MLARQMRAVRQCFCRSEGRNYNVDKRELSIYVPRAKVFSAGRAPF
jgi:hypothetical protein